MKILRADHLGMCFGVRAAIALAQHEAATGPLTVLGDLSRQGKSFDMVLIDPPSFSTTTRGRFTTRGGTSELVAAALPLLPEGGLLIASSNHQKVDISDYLKELRRPPR